MAKPLRAGVGRHAITPELGTLLMGYPNPDRRATAVRDPLHATALVLEGASGRAVVLSLDLCVIEDSLVDQIRQAAAPHAGVEPDAISVCAIQTHSGPCTQNVWGWSTIDQPYVEKVLIPGVVAAVKQAAAQVQPVRMGIATTDSFVGVNRRAYTDTHGVALGVNPFGPIDPTMTVLCFRSAKGPLANVVHYGAHPTVLSGQSTVISRDWPGVMVDRVEQLTGATTLYINGAVGDIAPRTNFLKAVGDGEAALQEAGSAAAMDAMRAWRSIKDWRDVDVHVLREAIDLPYRPLTPLDEAQRQFEAARADKDKPGRGTAEFMHWQAVVAAHAQGAKRAKRYHQTLTALGPVALAPMPGEPFADIVLRLRERSPFQHTLVASTSNGSNGYFCTRESLHRGGYEVWVARAFGPYVLAENIDDVLVESHVRLLTRLYDQVNPPL